MRSLGASDALRRALALEPRLKVMIAHGVADLETPYMMSRYVKDHMPDALGDRIALKLYAGGHMLYLRPESRHRLHDDARGVLWRGRGTERRFDAALMRRLDCAGWLGAGELLLERRP